MRARSRAELGLAQGQATTRADNLRAEVVDDRLRYVVLRLNQVRDEPVSAPHVLSLLFSNLEVFDLLLIDHVLALIAHDVFLPPVIQDVSKATTRQPAFI